MKEPPPRAVNLVAWVVGLLLVALASGLGVSARRELAALAASVTAAANVGALDADAERPRTLLAQSQPQAAASQPEEPNGPDVIRGAEAPTRVKAARLAPGEFEYCGLGTFKLVPRPTASAPDAMVMENESELEAAPKLAWKRVLEVLGQQGDERSQAVAWLLDGQAFDTLMPGVLVTHKPGVMLALVRLALASRDPTVVHWVLSACKAEPTQAACTGLNARHWIQLEPANAAAWAALLSEDPGAEAEALAGMARASAFDTNLGRFQAVLDRAFPPDLPAYLRTNIYLYASNLDHQFASVDLRPVIIRCQPPHGANDSNRRQLCDAMARNMVNRSRDLVSHRLGIRLGEIAGWPAETVATLQAERQAMMRLEVHAPIDMNQPASCESVRGLREWAQAMDTEGEMAWLRGRVRNASAHLTR